MIVYVIIPIWGRIILGRLNGSLKDGVKLSFNFGFISGYVELYVKDGWLYLKFEIQCFAKNLGFGISARPVSGG